MEVVPEVVEEAPSPTPLVELVEATLLWSYSQQQP
jgi:hypothetical protein